MKSIPANFMEGMLGKGAAGMVNGCDSETLAQREAGDLNKTCGPVTLSGLRVPLVRVLTFLGHDAVPALFHSGIGGSLLENAWGGGLGHEHGGVGGVA